MAMLYIHIPFCRKACNYCNFHFSTSLQYKEKMLNAILLEIERRKNEMKGETIKTIYFGGGTPSILPKNDIAKILNTIYKNYSCDIQEFTIESNPDDLTIEYINDLKSLTINRLSIGVQSFEENELQLLNRSHTAHQAIQSIQWAQAAGFDNINIDLMFGLPYQQMKMWSKNISQALQLSIQHISAYSLTIEERTALAHFVKKNTVALPQESDYSEMYNYLSQILIGNNFQHYEISNFAKEGYFSMHNSGYWKSEKYLGFGPSAHSFNLHSRQWNVSNNAEYMRMIECNEMPSEIEILNIKNKINEALMLGLRTSWGFDINKLPKEYFPYLNELRSNLNVEMEKGNIIQNGNIYLLSTSAKYISDSVFANIFIV